ncbi:hypothetical protein Hdeb2414_s0092g00789121 [Helianthus debilis subsp. tardiflorus]
MLFSYTWLEFVPLKNSFFSQLRAESILVRGLKWSKLLDPEKKGQWWLSGEINIENFAKKIGSEEAEKMHQLAAELGMNTPARRAMFFYNYQCGRLY